MNKEIEQQYMDVSPELRELWDVEMDLLARFALVCEKYHLQWYADGGTLLGAVRHRGFIPWDDDIDIIMPYEDYCKLCDLADEFEEPYFLQTWKTQKGWRPYLCRLRRSDTTGYTYSEQTFPDDWNKGIFIDIFAMSYIPDNFLMAGIQWLSLKTVRALYSGYAAKRDGESAADNKAVDIVLKGFFALFSGVYGQEKMADAYVKIGGWQKKPTRHCGPLLFRPLSKGLVWKCEWYKRTVMLDFMETKIPCPADYDDRLTCQYGDYMTPVKVTSFHGNIIYDTHHSYREQQGNK